MSELPGLTRLQIAILREAARRAIIPGPVKLTSGRSVSPYVSGHLLTAGCEPLALIGKVVAAYAADLAVDAIAGEETGGIPIVYAAAWEAGAGSRLQPFFFRKAAKPPFGLTNVPVSREMKVLLVDDVAGLGLAFERMVKTARDIGCFPVAALAIIDRQDGAEERLHEYGVPLHSLFQYHELRESARERSEQ